MILRNLSRGIRQQNWSVVFIELLVVIVGLVLAFQVDRWWEERADRAREQDYITRLASEVTEDLGLLEHAIELAEVRQGFGDLLLAVMKDPETAHEAPGMFLAAVAQAAFTYTPSLTTHTFEDLRSTGAMALIRSADIRRALYNYYGFHDAQRQYLQLNLNIEMRYFELSANVLDADQYQWVQDRWFVVTENDLDEVRAAQPDMDAFPAAVERFMANEALQAWIPRTRGVQREQLLMLGIQHSRAEELLAALRDYAAEVES